MKRTPMVWRARWRLASLWLSQVARVLADCVLRILVLFELIRARGWEDDQAWQVVTALLMLPAVFLAPLIGALSNALPKHLVLCGSAAYCFAVVIVFGFAHGPWLACWACVAIGAAVYRPTREALLPAASQDGRIALSRINGWFETGAMAATVAGFFIYGCWYDAHVGWPAVVVLAASLNLVALLTALPVRFPCDVRRSEPLGQAIAGFFRDCRRVWRIPEARGCLLGSAALRAIVIVFVGAVLDTLVGGPVTLHHLLGVVMPLLTGAALGSFLASLQPHPTRVLGLVSFGAAGLVICLVIYAGVGMPEPVLSLLLGVPVGLINVPLAATYQAALPADARGNGMALCSLVDYLAIGAASLIVFAAYHGETLSPRGLMWLVVLFAAVGAFVAWWLLLRQTLELVVEFLVWPMYRIRARGPGLDQFPCGGPLLIIANHSSWLDPVWIAKVLPRRVFPMMTSVFYDLPVMRWLMKLGGVIRVQATRFRREVPEIRNAVALLDRGDALLLFPEGWMRRSEQQPVRQFGRGVALLLKERPQTPVLICWIEGGFGSFFSYCNGPPTKNKRLDFRRRIEIGVTAPRVINPAIIADQRALRNYLMQACLDARTILGLPATTLRQPVGDRDEDGESDSPEQQEPHVRKG